MTTTIKPRTTTVLLYQGDDLDPIIERLQAVERKAKTTVPSRVGDGDPMADVFADYDTFMDEATERAVKVPLTAVGRKKYRELLNKHPMRMVDSPDGPVPHADDVGGFNRETFGDDLVPACMDASQFDDIDGFLDSLSDGDFSKLYSAAVRLNESLGPDPKARLSSHLAPTSDETSPSPARLGEASGSSTT